MRLRLLRASEGDCPSEGLSRLVRRLDVAIAAVVMALTFLLASFAARTRSLATPGAGRVIAQGVLSPRQTPSPIRRGDLGQFIPGSRI